MRRPGRLTPYSNTVSIAGSDVAYAYALLRCGTQEELAANPDNRLRLTLGMRKEHGRWVVAHEHHSFPSDSEAG